MTNIRNEREDMSPDPTYIKQIKRKHYEQLYAYGLHNFDEMDIRIDSTYTSDHFLKLLVL